MSVEGVDDERDSLAESGHPADGSRLGGMGVDDTGALPSQYLVHTKQRLHITTGVHRTPHTVDDFDSNPAGLGFAGHRLFPRFEPASHQ